MKDGLRGGIESHNGIRRTGGLVSELHPAEIERTQRKFASLYQFAFQRNCPVLFRLAGKDGLRSKCLVIYGLYALATKENRAWPTRYRPGEN